jgi:anti-sigma factor RsiW
VVGRAGVPTLVYQIRKHVISVTAIPDADHTSANLTTTTIRGYNIARWTADGVAYVAVSDVNAADLTKFAQAFRGATTTR